MNVFLTEESSQLHQFWTSPFQFVFLLSVLFKIIDNITFLIYSKLLPLCFNFTFHKDSPIEQKRLELNDPNGVFVWGDYKYHKE
jgi:hypothetical protein